MIVLDIFCEAQEKQACDVWLRLHWWSTAWWFTPCPTVVFTVVEVNFVVVDRVLNTSSTTSALSGSYMFPPGLVIALIFKSLLLAKKMHMELWRRKDTTRFVALGPRTPSSSKPHFFTTTLACEKPSRWYWVNDQTWSGTNSCRRTRLGYLPPRRVWCWIFSHTRCFIHLQKWERPW